METATTTPQHPSASRPRWVLWIVVAALFAAAYWWWAFETTDPAFGNFEGDVVTRWITDDLEMELVEPFTYVDPEGKRWTAPVGAVINGASIPSVFWSVIGGPFEGRFRKASVLHDSACETQDETWQDVHRMFYDACRCSRVGVGKAQTMYWAVYHFGPRWHIEETTRTESGEQVVVKEVVVDETPRPNSDIVPKAERYFARKSFTPREIEDCTVEQIEAEVAKWDAAKGGAATE